MRNPIFLFVLLLFVVCSSPALVSSFGQSDFQTDVTTEAKPWTHLKINNDPALIRFAMVSDHAGGPRPGILMEAVKKLNLLQPEFVLSVGDFIEGYEDTEGQLNMQWDNFMKNLAGLEMPFFFVPGNHDVGKPLWSEVYRKRFGVEYFHFVYKNVLFLCLSTNDGPEKNTGISQEQVDYASRVLSKYPDVHWTLVFQHKPLWNDSKAEGWKKIEALLAGRRCTVFAGHTHNYLSQEKDGISFITLATTGGGSSLLGPGSGEFDQIAWVTITDTGPRVANLLLDGIYDKDLRTPEKASKFAPFARGGAISVSPVLYHGETFSAGTSHLKISNRSDQPVRVQILAELPDGIQMSPGSLSSTIAAASETEIDLKITASHPIASTDLQPVVLHWTVTFDSMDNMPSTILCGEKRIMIDSPFPLNRVKQPVTIDGDLSEWTLPFSVTQPADVWHNPKGWKGPNDGSFKFNTAFDDNYYYVAIKTSDNEPCFDGWKYWEDFAVVSVDGSPAGSADRKKNSFILMLGPEISPEQSSEYSEGAIPEGVISKCRALSDGFEVEAAIPITYLKKLQGEDWKQVYLNIGFADFDRSDAREGVTILFWRPEWKSPAAYPEAGLFLRN